jgi:hypothetical protein
MRTVLYNDDRVICSFGEASLDPEETLKAGGNHIYFQPTGNEKIITDDEYDAYLEKLKGLKTIERLTIDNKIVMLSIAERESSVRQELQVEKNALVGLYFEMKSGATSRKYFRLAKKAFVKAKKSINEKYCVNIE